MNQPVRQVSIPELISDVDLYMSFKKKYNLFNFFYKVTFGLFFYNKTMHYYSQYTKYMYKIENKYKRITNQGLVTLPSLYDIPEAYAPNYNPRPSAPITNPVTV